MKYFEINAKKTFEIQKAMLKSKQWRIWNQSKEGFGNPCKEHFWNQKKNAKMQAKKDFEIHAMKTFEIHAKKDLKSKKGVFEKSWKGTA